MIFEEKGKVKFSVCNILIVVYALPARPKSQEFSRKPPTTTDGFYYLPGAIQFSVVPGIDLLLFVWRSASIVCVRTHRHTNAQANMRARTRTRKQTRAHAHAHSLVTRTV